MPEEHVRGRSTREGDRGRLRTRGPECDPETKAEAG